MRKAIMTSSSVKPLAAPGDGRRCRRQRVVEAAFEARRDGEPGGCVDAFIGSVRERSLLTNRQYIASGRTTIAGIGTAPHSTMKIRPPAGMNRRTDAAPPSDAGA
jgi:hypothetical protein